MSEEKSIRIIELSGKKSKSEGCVAPVLVKDDMNACENQFIAEEEISYFDNMLDESMDPPDQSIKLEGLMNEKKSYDTAREYEKLKQVMIENHEKETGKRSHIWQQEFGRA